MESSTVKTGSFLVLLVLAIVHVSNAGDPDISSDFLLPANLTVPDGNFFTFTGFRALVGGQPPAAFKVTKASAVEFPALNGQSVSYAVLQFPSGAVNPPHTHPRSAELLLLLDGSLQVGFVDTANKLYTQTLQTGDMFVFPKGLVHYQFNPDGNDDALAVSAFGSANAGTVSVPVSVFATGIDPVVLSKAFKTDTSTVMRLAAGLAPKA
ncbi:hypothetical protein ACLOJK_020837 [Asimina triloba]